MAWAPESAARLDAEARKLCVCSAQRWQQYEVARFPLHEKSSETEDGRGAGGGYTANATCDEEGNA